MGVIQYLKDYLPKMEPGLVSLDYDLGAKYTEDYILLAEILQRLGVHGDENSDTTTEPVLGKKSRYHRLGRMLSSFRSPRK